VSGPPHFLHAAGLPERLRLTEERRSFGVVLLGLIAAAVFQLATPETELAQFVGVAIQGSVIMLALRAAGMSRRIVGPIHLLILAIIAGAFIAVLGPIEVADSVPRLLTLVLILVSPIVIFAGVVRELQEDRRVTIQTIYCGICLYLLLGLAFAFLFGTIQDVGGDPFFADGVSGSPNDLLYFSPATLTTTGYGDFSAATELGRAVSVIEALIGQIYLVTVLAVIVSNVGGGRRTRGGEA
jgi:hypothetical protein